MDATELGVAVSILKKIPDTAVSDAIAAADRAESAATAAEQHSMGVSVSGTGLVFTNLTGGNG